MATCRCVATNPVASTLFTLDNVSKAKLTNITVDNQSAAARTLIFQDSFTTDPTVGAALAVVVKVLKQITVGAGLTASLDEKDLEDVEVIGALLCLADAAFATCVITCAYHEI